VASEERGHGENDHPLALHGVASREGLEKELERMHEIVFQALHGVAPSTSAPRPRDGITKMR
jgi:hypothetical protein